MPGGFVKLFEYNLAPRGMTGSGRERPESRWAQLTVLGFWTCSHVAAREVA